MIATLSIFYKHGWRNSETIDLTDLKGFSLIDGQSFRFYEREMSFVKWCGIEWSLMNAFTRRNEFKIKTIQE